MPEVAEIEAKVKEIIVQQLGVDADKVSLEASFVDDLGADSLDVVDRSEDGWRQMPDGSFLELRIDYDADDAAGRRLDALVRWVQEVIDRHEGSLIQLTMGDKGSYLYAAFGAPVAHEDDAVRAVYAALKGRMDGPNGELHALALTTRAPE